MTARGRRHRGGRPGRPPGSRRPRGRPGRDRAHQGVGTTARAVPGRRGRVARVDGRRPCSSRCRSVSELLARIDTSVGCSIKASFASLDMAAYGFRVLCAKAGLETSECQTVRQSPGAGEALFGARVLYAFAYWQGTRDRQIGARDGALLVSSHMTRDRLDARTRTVVLAPHRWPGPSTSCRCAVIRTSA
jgi:hypothetical protein